MEQEIDALKKQLEHARVDLGLLRDDVRLLQTDVLRLKAGPL